MGERIGHLFPLGGPVPPDLIIGRAQERKELEDRLREGLSTMLVGPRRAGKTTVCEAVCEALAHDGYLVFGIEVPERSDSASFLQLMIDRATRISLADEAKTVGRVLRPFVEGFLRDRGIPLDLSQLARDAVPADARTILGLPLELARHRGKSAVFFLDELQRVVSYADGQHILADLVDLYRASEDVVVLVDGSDQRTLDGMLGEPLHVGKLVDRLGLDPRLSLATWREPLTNRFAAAGFVLPDEQREQLLAWSEGLVYPTMAAARFTAFSAKRTATTAEVTTISDFDVRMGLDEAERHLRDDGA